MRGDSIGGAHGLVRHMIDLGHSHIAILTGPADASTSQDRVAGYEAALMHAGLRVDPGLIRYGEFRDTSGRQMMLTLLAERPEVTAVFAGNNAIALGVMEALNERGFRIPQDMALVCFDEVSPAANVFPFLTVAEQPAYEMGVEAARLLLSALESGEPLPPRHVMLPSRLIVRHSCARPRERDKSEAKKK